jgi:hypothetical protein
MSANLASEFLQPQDPFLDPVEFAIDPVQFRQLLLRLRRDAFASSYQLLEVGHLVVAGHMRSLAHSRSPTHPTAASF